MKTLVEESFPGAEAIIDAYSTRGKFRTFITLLDHKEKKGWTYDLTDFCKEYRTGKEPWEALREMSLSVLSAFRKEVAAV